MYGIITLSDRSFQNVPILLSLKYRSPITPIGHYYSIGLGFCAFARHYLRNHFCFLLLQVLRCFSSLRSPPINRISRLHRDGLPHSEIFGLKVICTSPKLIAAYHVLLRLREPRHPPFALSYFLSLSIINYRFFLLYALFLLLFSLPICQRSSFLKLTR